jgi:hypothetical protein
MYPAIYVLFDAVPKNVDARPKAEHNERTHKQEFQA